MTLSELKAQREAILAIAGRYGALNLRVFATLPAAPAETGTDSDGPIDHPNKGLTHL